MALPLVRRKVPLPDGRKRMKTPEITAEQLVNDLAKQQNLYSKVQEAIAKFRAGELLEAMDLFEDQNYHDIAEAIYKERFLNRIK